MNILYINHYAGSLYHGMEYRPYYLACEWIKLGHQVTIVASSYSHLRYKNVTIPARQKHVEEVIDGIKYIWCKTPAYPGNGFKRVINIFTFLYRVKLLKQQLISKTKPDLVIASSTYPFDTRIAYKIASKAKAKLVYEVHDLWPLTPIEVGGMSKFHPFIMLMQNAENFGYSHAHKVISLLPRADQYMQQHGMEANKFVYIPNGVAISDNTSSAIQPMPAQHLVAINKLRGAGKTCIIGYAGGMGKANALDFLLDAAKQVKDPGVAIVMIGDGSKCAHLKQRINDENIHNITLLPPVSKMEVPDFLANCDALYLGWNNLPIYRFGVCPNKIFDYMLAAKPVIHSITAGNDLVAEANCGISVAAEDIDAIASAIRQIAVMPIAARDSLGQNGANFVRNNHNYKHLAIRFLASCL